MGRKKTNMEIVKAIKKFLMTSNQSKFFKSDLRAINIEPGTAAAWFQIIELVQTDFPTIKVTEHESTMIIEVIEKKVQQTEIIYSTGPKKIQDEYSNQLDPELHFDQDKLK